MLAMLTEIASEFMLMLAMLAKIASECVLILSRFKLMTIIFVEIAF